jgi:riboflavin kinase/FMN adenylyltransferase
VIDGGELEAVVEPGRALGRTLGFPTANLHASAALPARGAWAAWAHALGRWWPAVVGVTSGPTIGVDGELRVEVHLLDFPARDIYGERMRVRLVALLREEQRFPDLDALRAAISVDVTAARAVLSLCAAPSNAVQRRPDLRGPTTLPVVADRQSCACGNGSRAGHACRCHGFGSATCERAYP